MLLIAQPKSASTSLLKTLSKTMNVGFKNGIGKSTNKNWRYCEGFPTIQRYHDTTIARSKSFLKDWMGNRKSILKDHILPTEKHMEFISDINFKIVIVLRNPEDSLDNYKRMYKRYKTGKMTQAEIKELMPQRFDWIDFDKYLFDLQQFNLRWKEFKYEKKLIITFEDLILNYKSTMIEIIKWWKFKVPKNIPPLVKAKGNHGYNTFTGVGAKRLKENKDG